MTFRSARGDTDPMEADARVGIKKRKGNADFAEKLQNSYNEWSMEFLSDVCKSFCRPIFLGCISFNFFNEFELRV